MFKNKSFLVVALFATAVACVYLRADAASDFVRDLQIVQNKLKDAGSLAEWKAAIGSNSGEAWDSSQPLTMYSLINRAGPNDQNKVVDLFETNKSGNINGILDDANSKLSKALRPEEKKTAYKTARKVAKAMNAKFGLQFPDNKLKQYLAKYSPANKAAVPASAAFTD